VKILVAEDDNLYRTFLQALLTDWGYEPELVRDGVEAARRLEAEDSPRLALLDWVMPGLNGPEVCRRVRGRPSPEPVYLILLTARDAKSDIVAGLESGANDYVVKPFDPAELQARVRVGWNVVQLQHNLACRVRELEEALGQVKQLRGLLPICSYCKKIRRDQDYWEQVEGYIARHADVQFSHGICPSCWEKEVQPQLEQFKKGRPGTTS
jgi:CheY-like chemotaxis protein